jgi:hypothetical protein
MDVEAVKVDVVLSSGRSGDVELKILAGRWYEGKPLARPTMLILTVC